MLNNTLLFAFCTQHAALYNLSNFVSSALCIQQPRTVPHVIKYYSTLPPLNSSCTILFTQLLLYALPSALYSLHPTRCPQQFIVLSFFCPMYLKTTHCVPSVIKAPPLLNSSLRYYLHSYGNAPPPTHTKSSCRFQHERINFAYVY